MNKTLAVLTLRIFSDPDCNTEAFKEWMEQNKFSCFLQIQLRLPLIKILFTSECCGLLEIQLNQAPKQPPAPTISPLPNFRSQVQQYPCFMS